MGSWGSEDVDGCLGGHAGSGQAEECTACRLTPATAAVQNPGFDFSGADFNGQVPDPQTFMGGIKHT